MKDGIIPSEIQLNFLKKVSWQMGSLYNRHSNTVIMSSQRINTINYTNRQWSITIIFTIFQVKITFAILCKLFCKSMHDLHLWPNSKFIYIIHLTWFRSTKRDFIMCRNALFKIMVTDNCYLWVFFHESNNLFHSVFSRIKIEILTNTLP